MFHHFYLTNKFFVFPIIDCVCVCVFIFSSLVMLSSHFVVQKKREEILYTGQK